MPDSQGTGNAMRMTGWTAARPVRGPAFGLALAIGTMIGVVPAPLKAETLPIEGVYPAGSDQLANLNSLAIGPFTREDGEFLSIELEQRLTGVRVRGAPYFSIVPLRAKGGADGTITGSATSSLDERREQVKDRVCAYEDAKGKCRQWRDVIINCTRRIVTLTYTLQVEGRRRERVFGVASTAEDSQLICPNSGEVPTIETAVAQLISRVANELRLQFAPLEVREDIRVKEGTDGLQNDAKKKFKEGIKLTKRNVTSACTVWAEVDQLVPDHGPTLFNLGLCAESRREYDAAETFYRRVFELNRSERYANEAIERLDRRRRAESQIAAHDARARR